MFCFLVQIRAFVVVNLTWIAIFKMKGHTTSILISSSSGSCSGGGGGRGSGSGSGSSSSSGSSSNLFHNTLIRGHFK